MRPQLTSRPNILTSRPNIRFELFSLYVAALILQSVIGIGDSSGISQTVVVMVSGLVVALTQILKWSGVPDKRGPIVVLVLALGVTAFLAWTQNNFGRATALDYFAVFVNILLASAGVFGFTRAAPEAVSSFTPPPSSGAGSNQTFKALLFFIASSAALAWTAYWIA